MPSNRYRSLINLRLSKPAFAGCSRAPLCLQAQPRVRGDGVVALPNLEQWKAWCLRDTTQRHNFFSKTPAVLMRSTVRCPFQAAVCSPQLASMLGESSHFFPWREHLGLSLRPLPAVCAKIQAALTHLHRGRGLLHAREVPTSQGSHVRASPI